MPPSPRSSAPDALIWAYVLALLAVDALLIAGFFQHLLWDGEQVLLLGLLIAAGIATSSVREPSGGSSIALSLTSTIILSAAVFLGPAGATLVGFATIAFALKPLPIRARLFNAGMIGLVGGSAGITFLGLSDGLLPRAFSGPADVVGGLWLPLVAAGATSTLVNQFLMAIRIRLDRPVPFVATVTSLIHSPGLLSFAYGQLSFLVVALWGPVGLGAWSVLLLIAPMMTAQWTLQQYGEERRSHQGVVTALVAAAEVGGPGIPGHAQRVAEICSIIAPGMGLGSRQAESLEYAALLHDLGMLGLPPTQRPKGRQFSDADLALLPQHPRAGLDMVEGLDFLAESLDGILHHHERWDGRGFPDGLTGEQIPVQARIIAVADAFDALTSPGPDHEPLPAAAAVTVLRSRTGSHLCPVSVEALARGLARRPWNPPPGTEEDWRRVANHDRPEVSDAWASWEPAGEVAT